MGIKKGENSVEFTIQSSKDNNTYNDNINNKKYRREDIDTSAYVSMSRLSHSKDKYIENSEQVGINLTECKSCTETEIMKQALRVDCKCIQIIS